MPASLHFGIGIGIFKVLLAVGSDDFHHSRQLTGFPGNPFAPSLNVT